MLGWPIVAYVAFLELHALCSGSSGVYIWGRGQWGGLNCSWGALSHGPVFLQ